MRRDIQSLRGVAILAVVLFHLGFTQIRGGFLGVDIFFVISGFVITTKLAKGDGPKWRQITVFYQARAKRILPASLVVILLISLFSLYFTSPLSLARTAQEALGSSLFSANLVFLHQQNNYLASTLDASPFLHYWSLGVEEQFYLLWPLLFIFFFKKFRIWIFPVFLLTTFMAILYTQVSPVNSFYLPITRVWEFLAGAVISVLPLNTSSKPVRRIIVWLAWTTIALSIILVSTTDATPGWTTLIPVVAAMVVIWGDCEIPKWLPLAWLGDISFTFYLVHWPIIIFIMNGRRSNGLLMQIILFFFSILVAFLITKTIERPFRFSPKLRIPLVGWGLVVAIFAGGTFALLTTNASSALTTNSGILLDTSLPVIYGDGCHLEYQIDWPKQNCVFGDPTSKTEVILAGDSHAAQWFPAMAKIASTKHWRLISLTKSSCPATLLTIIRAGVTDSSCQRWQRRLIAKINTDQPALVVIVNFTQKAYQLGAPTDSYAQSWSSGESKFLHALSIPLSHVAIIGDTPMPPSDSLTCLTVPAHAHRTSACDFTYIASPATKFIPVLAMAMKVGYIDPVPWLCSATRCSAVLFGRNVYRDNSHISVAISLAQVAHLQAALKISS